MWTLDTGLVDGDAGPHAGHELPVADGLADVVEQSDEDIECAAAKRDGLAVVEQQPLRAIETKRPE